MQIIKCNSNYNNIDSGAVYSMYMNTKIFCKVPYQTTSIERPLKFEYTSSMFWASCTHLVPGVTVF